jgi:hypothetical protein
VQSYYTFIALDIANQRARELEHRHLIDIALASDPESHRSIRRSAASLAAIISRASGRFARRLDEDANVGGALLGRSLAAPCTCANGRS